MKEHLRCLIWPRGESEADVKDSKKTKKTKVYRYVIVGVLVTDAPIEKLEVETLKKAHPSKISEVILDGPTEGLAAALTHKSLKHKFSKWPIGDASDWLVSMNENIQD